MRNRKFQRLSPLFIKERIFKSQKYKKQFTNLNIGQAVEFNYFDKHLSKNRITDGVILRKVNKYRYLISYIDANFEVCKEHISWYNITKII